MMTRCVRTGRTVNVRRREAFTLIELLTVMAIILILAGLILSIAGHVQGKASTSRATAEIQAFSTAINNYQIDNGAYPRLKAMPSPDPGASATYNTDFLDPRDASDAAVNYDPAVTTTPNYSTASKILYQFLCGQFYFDPTKGLTLYDSGAAQTYAKPTVYYTFTNSQLKYDTSGSTGPSNVTAIGDPFGFSYGYSTIYTYDLQTTPTTPPANGFNPTFDLWSTAGYSPSGGKTYPSNVSGGASATIPYHSVWVKNW